MKKIILLALTALMMAGCDVKQPDGTYKPYSYRTYIVDSCEYIGYAMGSQSDYLAHKGNCRFCEERDSIKWEKRKKELEELVEQLNKK
jgi:hypothetical protein